MVTFSFIKKLSSRLAGIGLGLLISSVVQAAPLSLGTPLITFDTGSTTFNATTGEFSFSALPAQFFDPTLSPPVAFIGPAASTVETLSVNIVVDSAGTLYSGSAGDDLVIEGSATIFVGGIPTPFDGILLTGEVVSFEAGADAASTDSYNLTFAVTGGLLSSFYPGGGVGINLTSESSTYAGDFTVDFIGGAKGQLGDQEVIVIPDACEVAVETTCIADVPPVDMLCAAKIAATTLLYTGPDMYGVDVSLVGTAGGNVTYPSIDLISGVTVLTAATEAEMTVDARPGDLGSKMTITVDGVAEVIHTSCSAVYVAGLPAPLDQPKGDPSPNWTVVSFVDKDGLVVDSTPVEPSSTCEIPPSGAGCFANGSPTSITFEYTGGGCAMSDSQALDEGLKPPTCDGALDEAQVAPMDTVDISAPGLTVTPSSVVLGDTFTVSGNFGSSTTIIMTDALGGTETNTFHTSCSAPLEVGDVFGGMSITLYNGEYGGTNVDFFYKVTNTGDTGITDVLVDDIFDGDVPGSPIASMAAGDMVTLTRTVSVINSIETSVTVSALSGEAVCDNAATVTVHETARPDKGSKGSKGSHRGHKKHKHKGKKGSHKRHKRSKGGRKCN